jgi:hypothetical protein
MAAIRDDRATMAAALDLVMARYGLERNHAVGLLAQISERTGKSMNLLAHQVLHSAHLRAAVSEGRRPA